MVKFENSLKSRLIFNIFYCCKQIFHISHGWISQEVKSISCEIFDKLFSDKDEDVGKIFKSALVHLEEIRKLVQKFIKSETLFENFSKF